jgi:hypothetical protein
MNNSGNFGMPGVRSERTATPRRVLWHDQGRTVLPSGVVIDGSKSRDPGNTGDLDVLRAGLLLGKITTGGKYAPAVLGLTGVLHDTSVVTTTMTLPAAVVTEISRRIGASGTFKVIGPPTAAGTVATETVTYSAIASATTITITATSADFAAGSIIAPTDGSETPRGIVDDGYGVKVTDQDAASLDVPFSNLLVGGFVLAAQIVNYSSMDASVKTWLKAQLRANGLAWAFDDDFR